MAGDSGRKSEWQSSLMIILAGWLIFHWADAAWHSKIRYVLQYDVNYAQVIKPNEPHNCDWLAAPIGDKNCHYEPQVQTIRTTTSTAGKPIVSYDDGKTWVANDGVPLAERGVFITWQKIDD